MKKIQITKKYQEFLVAILSGVILSTAWYKLGSGLFLFIGFLPVLFLENHIAKSYKKSRGRFFLLSMVMAMTWNLLATWWLKNATLPGSIAAFIVSSSFMSIALLLFHITRKNLGNRVGYVSFIIFWIAFEYSYLHGEFSWPWLTLGHGFLYETKLVQWYEFTGVLGGSLWVLAVNILAFLVLKNIGTIKGNKKLWIPVIGLGLLILIPITISIITYKNYSEKSDPYDIVVVQPNIDPYMKFNYIEPIEHAITQIEEAAKITDSLVDFVVTPETSLLGNFWIGHFNDVEDVHLIRDFLEKNPQCDYVAGIVCRKLYEPGDSLSSTARPYRKRKGYFYDYYNTAILVDTTPEIQMYHKSQLVTGIEKMPYARQLRFLENLVVELGGTFRGNAIQKERSLLISKKDSLKIAPVICWESVFGEYVTEYIHKGAEIIFIITNDGWWDDTPGHKHHNALASIRAIETRRSIARSANTGISSFVNQRGDVLDEITWWKRGAIRQTLNANNKVTFYVKYGDYIGRTAFWVGVLVFMAAVVARLIGDKP